MAMIGYYLIAFIESGYWQPGIVLCNCKCLSKWLWGKT